MFMHLGSEVIIAIEDIVAIIDIKLAEKSSATKEFLQMQQRSKRIIKISETNPKTFIITKDKVYYSKVSTSTLFARANRGLLKINEEKS